MNDIFSFPDSDSLTMFLKALSTFCYTTFCPQFILHQLHSVSIEGQKILRSSISIMHLTQLGNFPVEKNLEDMLSVWNRIYRFYFMLKNEVYHRSIFPVYIFIFLGFFQLLCPQLAAFLFEDKLTSLNLNDQVNR